MDKSMFEIVMNLIENFIIIQVMNYFLKLKYRYLWIPFVFLFTILTLHVNIKEAPLTLLLAFLVLNVFTLLNYNDVVSYKLVIASLIFITNVFLSCSIIALLFVYDELNFSILQENPMLNFLIVLLRIFLLVVIFFIIRNKLKKYTYLPCNWHLTLMEIMMFFLISSYCYYIYIENIVHANHTSAFMFFFLLLICSMLYVYAKYYDHLQKQEEEKNIRGEQEVYTRTFEHDALLEIYENALHNVREQSLLYKHHNDLLVQRYPQDIDVLCIKELLDGKRNGDVPISVNTANTKLNDILNKKASITSILGIQLSCFIEDELGFIEETDLLLMFNILMDHAIRISKRQRFGRIKLLIAKCAVGIKIELKCKLGLEKVTSDFSILEELVNKYQGAYDYFIKDETLIHKIILPVHPENKD